MIVLQHCVMGTPFPKGRTELYLLLLIVLSIVQSIGQWGYSSRSTSLISLILAFPFIFVFMFKFNFNRTHDWSFSRDIRSELSLIAKDASDTGNKKLPWSVAVDNIEFQSTYYYFERMNLSGVPIKMRYEEIDYPVANYYLVDTMNIAKLKRKATLLKYFPASGDRVMRDDSLAEAWNR